jgi:predicted small lipoprotein YifL
MVVVGCGQKGPLKVDPAAKPSQTKKQTASDPNTQPKPQVSTQFNQKGEL